MILALLACVSPGIEVDPGDSETASVDTGVAPEAIGAADEEDGSFVFADTGVLDLAIEIDEAALAELALDPRSYVEGALVFRGVRYEPVGVHIKGNSTYQWIDQKPAWKVKFDEYTPGGRFFGLERLTLDSNYWDGAQMAETLAYRAWRQADAPAPRTGYGTVSLNGEPLGLYTIVESMDDGFVERWWPGSEGGLYEMGRTCDVQLDCGCYDLQDSGGRFDPDGLGRACAAAASADRAEVQAHWDWDRLTRYQALERVVNHADSYTYNLNNYYLYHDPDTDFVTITPWGADSTFSYSYPPDEQRPCEPGYFDTRLMGTYGYLSTWCAGDAECWADVKREMLDIADQLEANDLAGYAERSAARIDPYVAVEPRWPWGYETWQGKAECFQQWIADRPAQIREFVEMH